jgi:hypothetical protein
MTTNGGIETLLIIKSLQRPMMLMRDEILKKLSGGRGGGQILEARMP